MDAVVIAVPLESPPARLGERFTLREGTPLRVGPGRDARLRLGPHGVEELIIGAEGDAPFVRVAIASLRASLCGEELRGPVQVPLREGDSLYVHPGLVLEFRARPKGRAARSALPARHRELEAQLCEADDDATWAVYRDHLEEVGDPLGRWLGEAASADEGGRRRQLLGLAESVRANQAEVTWSHRGMLSSVTVTATALTGAPGLWWQLGQLARLPVARLLPRVAIALFAGPAPGDSDALAARTLEQLAALEGAPSLRSVSLGFVSQARSWPRAEVAWQGLREQAPRLEPAWRAVVSGGSAKLSLLSRAPDIETLATEVVLNPSRTDVGTATTCLVRLVGVAPLVACTLLRSSDGQWVVFDESADPFRPAHGRFALRVNGAVAARASLAPGDVVEPVEGLRFLFNFVGG